MRGVIKNINNRIKIRFVGLILLITWKMDGRGIKIWFITFFPVFLGLWSSTDTMSAFEISLKDGLETSLCKIEWRHFENGVLQVLRKICSFFFFSYSFSFTDISSRGNFWFILSYIFQKRIKETLSVAAGEILKIERLFDKDFYLIFAFYKLWNSEKGNDTNLRTKFGNLWR